MATLDQLRSLFPDASSDADLINRASKEFGISPSEIAGEVGYAVPKGGLTRQQVSSSIDQYQGGLYGVAEAAASGLGAKGVSKWARAQREENELQADMASQRARELGAVDSWKDVHGVGDFGSYAKSMAIQSLPYAAEAMAGGALARGAMSGTRAALTAAKEAKDAAGVARAERALNIGSEVGGVAASYPSAVGDVLGSQREQSGETRGGVAAALAVPYAALNAVGVEGALMKGNAFKNTVNLLDRPGGIGGALTRTAATGASTALKEGASEAGQELMNQYGRMAVDPNEQLFSEAAQERFKESFIGGATLGGLAGASMGGWRRSGNQPSNDVSQAITATDTIQPDVTTKQFQAPVAPAPAMREHITEDGEIIQVPVGQQPPAVTGGSTEIAQAQQQAQQQATQQQAQAQQAQAAQQAAQQFGVVNPATPAVGNIFGQKVYGPNIPAVANAIATFTAKMPQQQVQLAQAITKANAETGGQLIKFKFNANDVMASVDKGFQAVGKVANQFQIAHAESVDEAAAILNDQSTQLKGDKLEQVNAIHQALTGEDTSGYIAAQQTEAEKGAKNDKLQLQTNAGVGTVPVQSGTGETVSGGDGSVRPTEVQPVGTTSVGAGPLDQQTGQLPAEGIRPSPGAGASVGSGESTPNTQVTGAANVQATAESTEAGARSGQANEPRETRKPDVVETVSTGSGGPRLYRTPTEYYNSDLMHIAPERRSSIVEQLLGAVLATKGKIKADQRVEIVRLTLMEGMTSREIAAEIGATEDAVEKQRERMGFREAADGSMEIALDTEEGKAFLEKLVAAASDFRSPEFPDGIGPQELGGLYAAKDLYFHDGAVNHVGEAVQEEQEGRPEAALAEELYDTEQGQTRSMGTVKKISGAQSAIESIELAEERVYAKIGKLNAMLDLAKESGDAAGVANIEKQLEAEWAKFGQTQAKRASEGEKVVAAPKDEEAGLTGKPLFAEGEQEETQTEEEDNAIQEPSAEEVPVRKRAGGRKAVGKGNAKGGKAAAEGETKVQAEPKQEEVIKTPQEQWAALAEQFPGMPPYESLSKDERVRWDDLANRGVANLAAANQVLENGPTLKSMSAPSEMMDFDSAGDQVAGLDLVRDQLEEAGIGHAVDLVSDWELTNDSSKDAEHGSLRTVNGRYVGTLNTAKLTNANYAAEVARHEIAHAIDMGPHGGIYSAQPEMGVSVVNGKITAEGPVAKELYNLYKTDAKWQAFLEYPFDSKKHPELNNRTKVQLELFAQAFSIYTTPEGRAILEAQAPVTAAYFKEVIQDVKSTKPLQIQKAEIAALRAAVLYTRRESKGNRGPSKLLGFDERVDELLASRSSQFGQEVKPAGVFAKAGEWLDQAITSPKETLHKLKLGFLTLDQLAELDKSPNQVVRAYSDVMTAMQKMSKDMVYKAAQIDQLWAKLDPKESERLSNVMRSATREQFDPAVTRTATNQEQQDILDAYNALTNSGRDVYGKVKKYYEDAFQTRLAIMEETAAKLGGKELQDIRAAYAKLKGPYFPLGRTGNYYAVGMSPRVAELTAKKEAQGLTNAETIELRALRKKGDQYRTSSFNTLREAKQAAEKFKTEMGSSYYNEVDIEKRLNSTAAKLPNFAKMEEYITNQLGGETHAEVKAMLNQMMFDMLPEHHALKNQMRREGIYGENEDMRQVFASTSISQAHYISRLQFGHELNLAMMNIGKLARRDIEMQQIKNELALRTKVSMDNTQSALTDAMVNASYFAHLGLSPAFLLTNMTQVPMITAPWLGARHGLGATKRAMATALVDTAKMIKSTYKDGDWRSELDWNSMFAVGSNEDRMFRDLLDRNVLDITMEHDLAAVANAQKGLFDDKISKATKGALGGMGDVVKLVNTPVRITELANRATTALSAYRLKMQALASSSMTAEEQHKAAVDYAARAVSETQLNYSELNAPRHMRQVFGSKPLAKMIFQFRKYQQGMLYLIAKSISDAIPGSKATKEDRRIARRTLAGLYMTTGLMAGTTGMPLMGTVGVAGIANLIAAAFGDEDEPWDFEAEYRNFLADWLGHDMALLVAKGLPAYLGADLSKRVGMGDIANPIPFVQRGQTGQSTVANVLYAAGGAPVGMVGTTYDGLVAMANGDVLKGVEKVIPIKAVKDALRTYRYADEGMTDKRGNVILPPEKFDTWDLALRGMGFTPTKESEYYEANAALQEAKTAATDVRTKLLRKYAEARMKDEDMDDINDEIDAFNERHPEKGVRIDVSAKLKSVQARRKMAAERTESGVRIGKYEKPFASEARFAEEQ